LLSNLYPPQTQLFIVWNCWWYLIRIIYPLP